MTEREIHKLEQYVSGVNVSVAFSVTYDTNVATILRPQILTALKRTTKSIPVLTCAFEETDNGGMRLRESHTSIEEQLRYSESANCLPSGEDIVTSLVDEARQITDRTVALYSLSAVRFVDGVVFYLVVNHSITDGPSVFSVVDTFMQHLTSEVDNTFVVNLPEPSNRDLVGELLRDRRCTNPTSTVYCQDEKEANNMLRFPQLTDSNCDSENNGCLRLIFREISITQTSAILEACRKNGVGFQSLLTSVATLALLKLLHRAGELNTESWSRPIGHIIPVNMRRYLPAGDNAAGITAMASVSLPWTGGNYSSFEDLVRRPFWSEFVYPEAHRPIYDKLNPPEETGASYLHQSLFNGENDDPSHGSLPYTLVATSVGNVTQLREQYGSSFILRDVFMQPGFYATSKEVFEHPTVPQEMINSGEVGLVMLHAYTIFGKLKLSGEYFAYSAEFISHYFDDIVRMLCRVLEWDSRETGEPRVGNIFELSN